MAAYAITTDSLIGSIRRRAFMPQDGDGSDTPSTLQLMNESVGWLQGLIEKERQGHYRRATDVALVGGQQDYSIPIRAAGGQLDIVVPVDSQGNPIDQMLVRDDVEWGAMYPPSQTASYPWRYFWMANSIRVYPPPSAGGYSLRMFYLQRISQLVLLASCWQVISVLGGGQFNTHPITTGLTPPSGDFRPNAAANGGSYSPGTTVFDIVSGTPPFDLRYQDLVLTSQTTPQPNVAIVGGGSGFSAGTITYNSLGGITAIAVAAGGSGYTTGQTVNLTGAGASGSGFAATIVASGGVITSILITNPGTAYCDGTQGIGTMTFTGPTGDTALSKVQPGDYICLQDTAPVLTWTMLEAGPVFAQYCAMKLLEARKDPQAYGASKDALAIETSVFQSFMAPRMRQQHNKVITGLGQFRWGARRTRPLGGYLR